MPADDPVPESPPRAWAEIRLDALRHNARLAAQSAGCPIMAVVKAGGYGHGLEAVAGALDPLEETAFFGVANVGEARRLTHAGIRKPIYILGATWEAERAEIVARDWVPCLSSLDEAADFDHKARAAGKVLTTHLAVDTGMGRGGFPPADLPGLMDRLDAFRHLKIDGIGSHMPAADEDEEFTRSQIARFGEILDHLGGAARFRWRHLANSAGLAAYELPSCNLARPGLLLYGCHPLPGHAPEVTPVMTLKSRVTLIRELPPGHGVSYGRTYVTTRPTRVATIGIGYGDGYPRAISGNGGRVWIAGASAPILGRVTMDQVMVDVTGQPGVAAGDEVELFGPNIPVAEIAERSGTIAWEVLTRITARVPRLYLSGIDGRQKFFEATVRMLN